MTSCSPQQLIEIFHLVFLRHLEFRLEKSLYAVKGGCNLRFFCKSIRYSEDLDLDVRITSLATLKKNVDKILGSQNLRQALSIKGIQVVSVHQAKQTDTTQRWKIGIQTGGSSWPLPTKIEFSRRRFGKDVLFETIDPEIIRTYGLYPIAVSHYSKNEALRQKLSALLCRKETQARDLFDIHVLMNLKADPRPLPEAIRESTAKLLGLARGIDFDRFKSQVLAYLMPEQTAYYQTKQAWLTLQSEVLAYLEGLS